MIHVILRVAEAVMESSSPVKQNCFEISVIKLNNQIVLITESLHRLLALLSSVHANTTLDTMANCCCRLVDVFSVSEYSLLGYYDSPAALKTEFHDTRAQNSWAFSWESPFVNNEMRKLALLCVTLILRWVQFLKLISFGLAHWKTSISVIRESRFVWSHSQKYIALRS